MRLTAVSTLPAVVAVGLTLTAPAIAQVRAPHRTACRGVHRVTGLLAIGISCSRARAVVRDFYAQEIGSAGAADALGYGCAYGSSGATVSCRERTGNTYNGPVRVRWREGTR